MGKKIHTYILFCLALLFFLPSAFGGEIGKALVLPEATIQQGITLRPDKRLNALPRHGWRLLHCEAENCMMTPVIVEITSNSSELLEIRARLARGRLPNGHESIALFHGSFPESSIPARFTPRTPRKEEDVAFGTLGVEIKGVGEAPFDSYRFLPRSPAKVSETTTLQLYVETSTQRQSVMRLPIEALFTRPKTRDFLRFAGDLDGDSKLDFVVVGPQNTEDLGGNKGDIDHMTSQKYEISGFQKMAIRVFLSTKAKSGNLLGLAAETRGWSYGVHGGDE